MSRNKDDLTQIQVGAHVALKAASTQLPAHNLGPSSPLAPTELALAPGSLRYLDLVPQSQRQNKALDRRLRKSLTVTPADPDQALTPLLNEWQKKQRRGNAFENVEAFFGVLAVPSFLVSGLVSGITGLIMLTPQSAHAAALQQMMMSITLPMLAVSAPLGGNLARMIIKNTRSSDELYRLAGKRFAEWLWLRHKIEVKLNQSDHFRLLSMLVSGEGTYSKHIFMAEDGCQYALVKDEGGTFHVEQHNEKKKASKKKAKALAVAIREISPESPFTGEASVLFTEVRELLAKLTKREMSVEDDHVFKRAREDLTQLAALNDQLHELDGPRPEEDAHFKEILLGLRNELRAVLERQRALVAKDVAVAAAYVKDRQAKPVAAQLNLWKAPNEHS